MDGLPLDGGETARRYHERRLQFASEFLAQFPDEGADTHVNFMRARGEALWKLGRRDEAEATFAVLLERFPDEAWGYTRTMISDNIKALPTPSCS